MQFLSEFILDLPHGTCIGIGLPETELDFPNEALEELHPEERAYADTLRPRRKKTWIGGRLALRKVLRHVGVDPGPILSTARGAPAMEGRICGSISHKEQLAVALVNPSSDWRIGIDVEFVEPRREGIEQKVLTAPELEDWRRLPEDERWRNTVLRFALKEAIYKAIDPFVERYVGFDEVSVHPKSDGTTVVQLHLKKENDSVEVESFWVKRDQTWIATARARSIQTR